MCFMSPLAFLLWYLKCHHTDACFPQLRKHERSRLDYGLQDRITARAMAIQMSPIVVLRGDI